MANYGYVHMKKKLKRDEMLPLLRETIAKMLPGPWEVKETDWDDEGPVWFVFLPGTAQDREGARKMALAPGQDVGFPVALQGGGKRLAFRHMINFFESWAQGRIEEELGEQFGVGVEYDATDETYAPTRREYRRGKTYFEYLSRNFDKPLSKEDEEFLNGRFREMAPPGFWRGEEFG
jgi:hypothetical protein